METFGGNDYYTFCYCIKTHLSDINNKPNGVDGATYWKSFAIYPYDNAVYHVIQQRSDFHLPNFVRGNGVFDPTFTGSAGNSSGATNCAENKFCLGAHDVVTGNAIITNGGNIKLFDAINHFLTGSGLTFHSDFFSLSTNPVTLSINPFINIYLSHKAYIKCNNALDPISINELLTIKAENTLEDLINNLCDIWPLAWYIDTVNNYFVLEHIKFFENGKQYSGSPGIYADLTNKTNYPIKYQTIEDPAGQPTDGEFSFGADSYQKEIFKFNDTVDLPSEILYPSKLVKAGQVFERDVKEFSTDITYAVNYSDSLSDSGFCLLACGATDIILRRNVTLGLSGRTLESYESPTVLTNYANGDLFFDNLIRAFWIYSRYWLTGTINPYHSATVTTFTTQKRTKKQVKIRIPRITGVFDPSKLITTNQGNGEVESYEYTIDTDFITVNLLYAAG